jgi:L-alanine-DL-glutamate epimerase-like enolase superfamily enzyme
LKITNILEKSVPLKSNVSNSVINFSTHTVSLVALVTDQVRNGKPVIGLSFNSIGRYAQSGIIAQRMAPRLLAAKADSLLQDNGQLSAEKVLACAMQNEKPGGHGDRAHAASGLELAVWDLNAKLNDEPVSALIARHFGRTHYSSKVSVYAAGGYYYPGEQAGRLEQEFSGYRDLGFDRFKMKIGGASLTEDMARIERALTIAGTGQKLAVDANGRFSLEQAIAYGEAMQGYDLLWYEEAGDPLDFELNALLAKEYKGALATGENLFSRQDVKNLALFGGARPDLDIFQMDPGLCYGVTEYARILTELESRGFDRTFCYPHSGQLLGLHVVAGLGLGGCEVYPGVFQPMGGFGDSTTIEQGVVKVSEAAGFGFEQKANLMAEFATLVG